MLQRHLTSRGIINWYVRFHEELVSVAASREFARFYQTVVKKLTLFRQRTLAQGDAIEVSNREHHAIMRHLGAGDAKAAGRAMQKHILASSARMQKALRAFQRGNAANQNAGYRATQSATRPASTLILEWGSGLRPPIAREDVDDAELT